MTFLLTLLVIGIIATVHELGHYFVAKRQHIPVKELSIGIGPKIMQKSFHETMFSLRLIPIFAYVQLGGTTPDEEQMRNGFMNASPGAKAKVLFAGSVMNVVLAIVIFIILFMGIGIYSEEAEIGQVYENSAAQLAGIEAGDEIVAIDGTTVSSWEEMSQLIQDSKDEILLSVSRDEQQMDISLTPAIDEETGRKLIGIERARIRLNLFQAVYQGTMQSLAFIIMMLQGLWMMISGTAPADVSGPVGIANMVREASSMGLTSLAHFTAILSLNLAIINLLPIPGLDGGKLMIVLLEKVRGKRLPFEKEAAINLIGFALLIAIMLIATYKDLMKLIGV